MTASSSLRYCSLHFARCSFPDDVLGSVPGRTSITSRGGIPQTSQGAVVHAGPHTFELVAVDADLGDDDHALLALVALDTEGDHVAGTHAIDRSDGALDVLGEHVAPADDDHVLDPPAQDELAVEQVGQISGAQPTVAEQTRRWHRHGGSSRG